MIRPRGGDFCYSRSSSMSCAATSPRAHALGADGVVLGLLRRRQPSTGAAPAR